ncbi:hypothetical protein EDB85DRAFT_302083 [Lactarius pseudohatsudake]|nr:hypothetical protein EDB85DRAFT_302083 [Lactarius pseudohatsudake]
MEVRHRWECRAWRTAGEGHVSHCPLPRPEEWDRILMGVTATWWDILCVSVLSYMWSNPTCTLRVVARRTEGTFVPSPSWLEDLCTNFVESTWTVARPQATLPHILPCATIHIDFLIPSRLNATLLKASMHEFCIDHELCLACANRPIHQAPLPGPFPKLAQSRNSYQHTPSRT